MKKEILIAVLCFTLSAIVITLVGMFVCPEIGGTIAAYYTDISQTKTGMTSVPGKAPSPEVAMKTDSESVPDEAPEKTLVADAGDKTAVKAGTEAPGDTKKKAELAEKADEPESPAPVAPVRPTEDAGKKAELAEKAAESPAPGKTVPEESATAAKEPKAEVKKKLTAREISKLTKSLKKGESLKLSDGRIAYKVNSGDVFSRICRKVLGTSLNWRNEAKKMGINPRRIFPGKVLIFEKD